MNINKLLERANWRVAVATEFRRRAISSEMYALIEVIAPYLHGTTWRDYTLKSKNIDLDRIITYESDRDEYTKAMNDYRVNGVMEWYCIDGGDEVPKYNDIDWGGIEDEI